MDFSHIHAFLKAHGFDETTDEHVIRAALLESTYTEEEISAFILLLQGATRSKSAHIVTETQHQESEDNDRYAFD